MGILFGKYFSPDGGPADAHLNLFEGRYSEGESSYNLSNTIVKKATKILETHSMVEEKTAIYVPYNILPLDPDSSNQAIMKYLEGRGGPGMVANVDPQKQFGGPTVTGDSDSHQPIGLQVAMAAASVMAGVLGGAQGRREMNQNGLQGQPALYSDPFTLHLAKMSRNQLNEVMFELKVMAMQNKEQARQLLLANPQLEKAVFESHLRHPNIQEPAETVSG